MFFTEEGSDTPQRPKNEFWKKAQTSSAMLRCRRSRCLGMMRLLDVAVARGSKHLGVRTSEIEFQRWRVKILQRKFHLLSVTFYRLGTELKVPPVASPATIRYGGMRRNL